LINRVGKVGTAPVTTPFWRLSGGPLIDEVGGRIGHAVKKFGFEKTEQGKQVMASHESCSKLYNWSCKGFDELVEGAIGG
jgi:hypothetical protein